MELRAKLSRDTETKLTATLCAGLLESAFPPPEGGELVSLQRDPGLVYVCLGEGFAARTLACSVPSHVETAKVAAWYTREAAEVHIHPGV